MTAKDGVRKVAVLALVVPNAALAVAFAVAAAVTVAVAVAVAAAVAVTTASWSTMFLRWQSASEIT